MLGSFFEVNLPQTFDARTNRKTGLALLIGAIARRVQRAVVEITPSPMSRHEDNLRHFGTNRSGTGHRQVGVRRLSQASSVSHRPGIAGSVSVCSSKGCVIASGAMSVDQRECRCFVAGN